MKHLSSNDIEKLQLRLTQMRARLLDEIQTAEDDIEGAHEALEGEVRSGSDASELTRLEELRRSEIEADENQLNAVAEAERRMDAGLYGICAECGETIPVDRLFALPTAVRCTSCEGGASR